MVRRTAGAVSLALALAACSGPRVAPPASQAAFAPSDETLAEATETPIAAGAFVDSIGVNTHIPDYLYAGGRFRVVIERMKELGIRHVRDDIYQLSPRQYRYSRAFLEQTHSEMEAIVDCPRPLGYEPGSNTPPKIVRDFVAGLGGRVELIEGPNEPDLRGVKDWAPLTVACIRRTDRIYSTPYVAPAMGNAFNSWKLGRIGALVGIGAIHRYFSGFNPGNDGFWKSNHCGTWGQLAFSICEARINSGPNHPMYVTETGWTTPDEIDEKSEGKYVVRVLLYDAAGGIARTYLYDLYDDGPDSSNSQSGFGLIRYDGTGKPSFYGVRSLVRILADPGPSFAPTPLTYAIAAPKTVDHLLLQKRGGTYVLAIWNEVESWNVALGRDNVVPPRPVAIVLPRAARDVSVRSLDDAELPVEQTPAIHGNRIVVNVDDRVTFVEFR